MIFFYVSIGLAMLTTIVAIFETSLSINKNQYTTRKKQIDSGKIILQKQNDIKFLQMLTDLKGKSLGSGQLICENLKNGYTNQLDSNYYIISKYSLLNNYTSGIPSYTSHSRLKDGCDLVYDSHRVLIIPNKIQDNTYKLYSCIIEVEPKCPFEVVN